MSVQCLRGGVLLFLCGCFVLSGVSGLECTGADHCLQINARKDSLTSAPLRMVEHLVPGEGWRSLGRIGCGSHGCVWEVQNLTTEGAEGLEEPSVWAMKVSTAPDVAHGGTTHPTSLAHECDMARLLHQRCPTKFVDCRGTGSLTWGPSRHEYAIFEKAKGTPLQTLVGQGLPTAKALPILAGISEALRCSSGDSVPLGENPIVLGDINPENVLLEIDDDALVGVKIVDYGSTSFVDAHAVPRSRHRYTPPEGIADLEKRPFAFDVYSTGKLYAQLRSTISPYDVLLGERDTTLVQAMINNVPSRRPSPREIVENHLFLVDLDDSPLPTYLELAAQTSVDYDLKGSDCNTSEGSEVCQRLCYQGGFDWLTKGGGKNAALDPIDDNNFGPLFLMVAGSPDHVEAVDVFKYIAPRCNLHLGRFDPDGPPKTPNENPVLEYLREHQEFKQEMFEFMQALEDNTKAVQVAVVNCDRDLINSLLTDKSTVALKTTWIRPGTGKNDMTLLDIAINSKCRYAEDTMAALGVQSGLEMFNECHVKTRSEADRILKPLAMSSGRSLDMNLALPVLFKTQREDTFLWVCNAVNPGRPTCHNLKVSMPDRHHPRKYAVGKHEFEGFSEWSHYLAEVENVFFVGSNVFLFVGSNRYDKCPMGKLKRLVPEMPKPLLYTKIQSKCQRYRVSNHRMSRKNRGQKPMCVTCGGTPVAVKTGGKYLGQWRCKDLPPQGMKYKMYYYQLPSGLLNEMYVDDKSTGTDFVKAYNLQSKVVAMARYSCPLSSTPNGQIPPPRLLEKPFLCSRSKLELVNLKDPLLADGTTPLVFLTAETLRLRRFLHQNDVLGTDEFDALKGSALHKPKSLSEGVSTYTKKGVLDALEKRPSDRPCNSNEDCTDDNGPERLELCRYGSAFAGQPTCGNYYLPPVTEKRAKNYLKLVADVEAARGQTLKDLPSKWSVLLQAEDGGFDCSVAAEVQDQENCGVCWAFAIASTLSQAMCLATKGAFNSFLSPGSFTSFAWGSELPNKGVQGYNIESAWEESKNHNAVPAICRTITCAPQMNEAVAKAAARFRLHRRGKDPVSSQVDDRLLWSLRRAKTRQNRMAASSTHEHNAVCENEKEVVPVGTLGFRKIRKSENVKNLDQFEANVMKYLMENGPMNLHLKVPFSAPYWRSRHNVFRTMKLEETSNHALVLIGWGEQDQGLGKEPMRYWLVQNSWGKSFLTDGGVIKIQRGHEKRCIDAALAGQVSPDACGYDPLWKSDLFGPILDPKVVAAYMDIETKCQAKMDEEDACLNNGYTLAESCKCLCHGFWTGDHCETCSLNTSDDDAPPGAVVDVNTCAFTCPEEGTDIHLGCDARFEVAICPLKAGLLKYKVLQNDFNKETLAYIFQSTATGDTVKQLSADSEYELNNEFTRGGVVYDAVFVNVLGQDRDEFGNKRRRMIRAKTIAGDDKLCRGGGANDDDMSRGDSGDGSGSSVGPPGPTFLRQATALNPDDDSHTLSPSQLSYDSEDSSVDLYR